jgi:hypothetical protein
MKANFENGHLFPRNGDTPSEIQGAKLNGRANGKLHRTRAADLGNIALRATDGLKFPDWPAKRAG